MKKLLVLFAATALALHADDGASTNTTANPAAPTEDATAAHQGYPASRYEDLWTKSPFAVETPDETVTDSAEYSLVGVAQLTDTNGTIINYVSLVEKQNQNHLLVSSDKPLNGLSLNSITKKPDGGTYATLTHDGQILTLELETTPSGAAGLQPGASTGFNLPGMMTPNMPIVGGQNIQMPGAGAGQMRRPLIRIRRPIIHVPPRPQMYGAPAGQPAPPPGAQ
jgi:hypothetical protein